ncbi:MAG: MoaD/ThiS family protein [Candidatus Izemoplasmataceae bacterium]
MITVKLYAYLREPHGKEVHLDHETGMTVRDIAEKLDIPLKRVSIIICDGKDGTPEKMLDHEVKADSLVHFFPPVAGG